jgi:chitinase
VADFVERYQLDGLDIDWEYPNQTGAGNVYREEDIENFTLLLKACREKLDLLAQTNHKKEGYLLTIATGADSSYIRNTQLGEVQKYLDFINIMTYDFYNGLHHKTGHHSNLKPSPLDPDGNSLINSVQMHLDAGIPANKLNIGIPFYGRKWEGVNPENNGLYQKTATTGQIIYYRILKKDIFHHEKYIRYWDEDAEVPYLWNSTDSIFISYDDVESIRLKMEYIKNKGLGGAMFWEYTDNPEGELLKTIYEGLSSGI